MKQLLREISIRMKRNPNGAFWMRVLQYGIRGKGIML